MLIGLIASCCHGTNSSISSSICDANHIEKNEGSLGQDKVLNGASSNSLSSSSHGSHICLMARYSNHNDVEDNGEDEDNEKDYIDYLNKKDKVVFDALHNNKNVFPNLFEIMSCATESTKLIEMKKDKIDKIFSLEREYSNDIHDLKYALEQEQELRVSLEEKLESIEESHNEIISELTKDRDIALAKLSSPIDNDNDACATNSTSCEVSILKENVELRTQLELLTSKYGKLEKKIMKSYLALMRIF
jgi:hypothetical protein